MINFLLFILSVFKVQILLAQNNIDLRNVASMRIDVVKTQTEIDDQIAIVGKLRFTFEGITNLISDQYADDGTTIITPGMRESDILLIGDLDECIFDVNLNNTREMILTNKEACFSKIQLPVTPQLQLHIELRQKQILAEKEEGILEDLIDKKLTLENQITNLSRQNNSNIKVIKQKTSKLCIEQLKDGGKEFKIAFDFDLPFQKVDLGKICGNKKSPIGENSKFCSQYVTCIDGTKMLSMCKCSIVKDYNSTLEGKVGGMRKRIELAKKCINDMSFQILSSEGGAGRELELEVLEKPTVGE